MRTKEVYKFMKDTPEIITGLASMIIGNFIGEGEYRRVYEHSVDETLVVKIQNNNYFSNIIEWEIWNIVKGTEHEKWFAPCTLLSYNGKILFQTKVEPINKYNEHLIPDKIPYYFSDIKRSNFGFIGEQLVCHDYDFSIDKFVENGLNKKMQSSKELKNSL